MVVYSNKVANESEIRTSYSDAGYVETHKPPEESADELAKNGVNVTSLSTIQDVIIKTPVPSPMLKKKRTLKLLFLQYIKKYISKPSKYIEHVKQIKNMPSWFDDAIVLFNDAEISREQKRMIREYITGLIEWRDHRLFEDQNIEVNATEANRQLGERSMYLEPGEDLDSALIPRQNDVQRLDLMGIAKNVAAQNVTEMRQPTMEEYVQYDGTQDIPMDLSKPNIGTAGNIGELSVNRPSSTFSLNDYIMPMGRRASVPPTIPPTIPSATPQIIQPLQPQQMSRSAALAASTQNTSFRPTSIPIGNMNIDLTSFIMGGARKPSIFPQPSQPVQQPIPQPIPQPTPQPQPTYRKQNTTKPMLNRKIELGGIIPKGVLVSRISLQGITKKPKSNKSVIPKGISIGDLTLKNIMRKSKPIKQKSIIKGISLKGIMGKTSIKPSHPSKIKKTVGVLDTVKNMDKVFSQVKNQSKNSYSAGNMKMKIVSDIKNQCETAFKNNKFKTESINIKKNFMKDMKDSLPNIRMEMQSMGDIRERNDLDESMRGIPKMLQVGSSTPFMVKRGSMRPKSVGITEYDFSLGNIYKKGRKSQPTDEEYFYASEDQ